MKTRQIILFGLVFMVAMETASGAWGFFRSSRGGSRPPPPRPNPRGNCAPIVRWSPCESEITVMTETARPRRGELCPPLAEPRQVSCMSTAQLITDDCTYIVQYDFVPCGFRERRYIINVASADCPANSVTIRARCSRGIMNDVAIVSRAMDAGRSGRGRRQRQERAREIPGRERNIEAEPQAARDRVTTQPARQRDSLIDLMQTDIEELGMSSLGTFQIPSQSFVASPVFSPGQQVVTDRRQRPASYPERAGQLGPVFPDSVFNPGIDGFIDFLNDLDLMWQEEQNNV